ncbi:HTH_Tnp_Tc3_2 domain-containing protein [Trichonephila clavipes]|uniref:HTH_Tnp_Tc3_2 domain-containing protein n=1 Tax=Trichonephila clavipes TaxID=2585209 RepID=A0A8X6RC47_TRICX|nr:HTH_Tnp_Tc3_2 domain-containing protein [Trichonephila clavipes]
MVKQNRSQTMAQLSAQYNAGPCRIVSDYGVQQTLLDMGLRSKRYTPVPLLTKCHHQLHLRWDQEHDDWSMDQIHRLPGEQLLTQCTVGHTLAGGGGIMLWGKFPWTSLGRVVVVEQTMNATEYQKHHCGPIAPLHGLCYSRWKWKVPTGQRPMSQG